MVARLGQDAKRRAEEKTASVREITPPRSAQEIILDNLWADEREVAPLWDGSADPWRRPPGPQEIHGELCAAALWDEAVASLGRSAGVLEELAESTGEAVARIAARGDRIDRIQKETRALLNALVASEAVA